MPVDPNILLASQPIQAPSPLDAMTRVLTLRHLAQQSQLDQSTLAERQETLAKNQRANQDSNVIDQVMQQSMKPDPDTGIMSFDRGLFQQGLVSSGRGHLYPQLSAELDKLDKDAADMAAKRRSVIARTIYNIQQNGATPDAVLTGASYLKANGALTQDHIQPVLDAIKQNPDPQAVNDMLTRIASNLPEYRDLVNAEEKRKADLAKTRADTAKTTAETVNLQGGLPTGPEGYAIRAYAQKLNKPVTDLTPDEKVSAMQFAKESNADPEMRALMISQKNLANAMAQMQLNQMPTKEQAADVASDVVNHRIAPEQLANLFSTRGKEGLSFKLMVADEAKKIDPNFNWEQAASEYALSKSTGFQNTVRYMDSVQESMPQLLKSAQALANGNVRSLNAAENWTKDQLNNVDLAKFNTDRTLVADEIAKLLQGGGSGAATSDAKLNQAASLLRSSDSPQAIAAVLNEANTLIGYRRKALTRGTYLESQQPALSAPSQTTVSEATPNVSGLKPGQGRQFTDGPFKGQLWTVDAQGNPKRIS